MELRELGHTGVMLPEVGLGTWRYTGGVGPLRAAVELGAFHIDTAESYGTEEAVGEAIRGIRDRVFLATKVSPSHFRYRDVLRACDASLRRLRTDVIDLYQLHWPNPRVPIEETMRAMEELAEAGKVRFIGVSNFSVGEMRAAQAALRRHRIVSNQVLYNLVDRGIERDVLPFCQEQGVTIIAYSPLATGLSSLLRRDREGALPRVAQETGRTVAQVALNWCLARPGVVTIPKANSVEHIREDCGASGWRLSEAQRAALEGAFG